MPVPVSTAFLAAGAIFLPISETVAGVLAGIGAVNQVIVYVGGYFADRG